MELNLRERLLDSGEIELTTTRHLEEITEPDKIDNKVSGRSRNC